MERENRISANGEKISTKTPIYISRKSEYFYGEFLDLFKSMFSPVERRINYFTHEEVDSFTRCDGKFHLMKLMAGTQECYINLPVLELPSIAAYSTFADLIDGGSQSDYDGALYIDWDESELKDFCSMIKFKFKEHKPFYHENYDIFSSWGSKRKEYPPEFYNKDIAFIDNLDGTIITNIMSAYEHMHASKPLHEFRNFESESSHQSSGHYNLIDDSNSEVNLGDIIDSYLNFKNSGNLKNMHMPLFYFDYGEMKFRFGSFVRKKSDSSVKMIYVVEIDCSNIDYNYKMARPQEHRTPTVTKNLYPLFEVGMDLTRNAWLNKLQASTP